jgi:hypothetical protein
MTRRPHLRALARSAGPVGVEACNGGCLGRVLSGVEQADDTGSARRFAAVAAYQRRPQATGEDIGEDTSRKSRRSVAPAGATCPSCSIIPRGCEGGRGPVKQLEIDRDGPVAPAAHPSTDVPVGSGSVVDLSDLDRRVVLRSARDPLSSLQQRRPASRMLMGWLFGREANALADPRLEALRRFAVILRIHGLVTNAELDRFHAAGFNARSAAAVEQMVAPWRRRSNSKLQRLAWSFVGLVAFGSYQLVVRQVEQPMVGLISAGLVVVLIAPLLVPRNV